jgi:hypothetical protein
LNRNKNRTCLVVKLFLTFINKIYVAKGFFVTIFSRTITYGKMKYSMSTVHKQYLLRVPGS